MPLQPGNAPQIVRSNIREMIAAGHPQRQAVAAALNNARQHRADGGDVTVPYFAKREAAEMTHTGPIISTVPGRTDHLPISVPPNSFVLPSDVVSGLPGAEGNTMAGHRILNRLLGMGPYGSQLPRRAEGGSVQGSPVPIMAAGGEYVVPPEIVERLGNGDMKRGHDILDSFVKKVRARHVKTLRKLPGPVKK